jgi:glucokinase
MICNGELVRSGRFLHPEGGHIIVRFDDASAPCGCGNFGCAEAYLSGKNFEKRGRIQLGNPTITAKEIADLARQQDRQALALFDEYANIMAVAIQNYVRLYSPEIIVFTGSFAAALDLFQEKTQVHLNRLLARQRKGIDLMPKLALSTLNNEAGIIGGAYVAFHSKSHS